jgi:hypothetical protein
MSPSSATETSVDFQHTTRRYIPEDRTLHNQRCENFKCYTGRSLSESENELLHCGLLDYATVESGSSFRKNTLLSSKGWGHVGSTIIRKCDNHLPDYMVPFMCAFYDAGNNWSVNQRILRW